MIESFYENNLVLLGFWTITSLGLLFLYGLLAWAVVSVARHRSGKRSGPPTATVEIFARDTFDRSIQRNDSSGRPRIV